MRDCGSCSHALPGGANFVTPRFDGLVFGYALLLSLATGFLFCTAPALRASRADLAEALNETGRTLGRSRGGVNLGNALLVGQVAFSFLLLVTAALFLRSIGRAYEMDPGFQTAHLAVFSTNAGQAGYTREQTKSFYKEARDRVARMPGIASAAWSSNMPLWARALNGLQVEGRQQRSKNDTIRAIVNTVDPAYFDTAGVEIDAGRDFTDFDRDNSAPVAIVNETMAREFWPAGALGHRIQLPGDTQFRQIVGVARTANYTAWGEPPQFCVYVPLEQNYSDTMALYIRTKGDPLQQIAPVEREIHAAGPQIVVTMPRTGRQIIDGGLFSARMGVAMLSVFGLLALGLASIGLYGILAYTATRRQREIGLRMALGASRISVLRLVLGQGMSLVLVGVGIGLAGSLADRPHSRPHALRRQWNRPPQHRRRGCRSHWRGPCCLLPPRPMGHAHRSAHGASGGLMLTALVLHLLYEQTLKFMVAEQWGGLSPRRATATPPIEGEASAQTGWLR